MFNTKDLFAEASNIEKRWFIERMEFDSDR
jgi:hypothetical protein